MENTNKNIAQMLKHQRIQNNLSVKEVVALLMEYYQIHISEKTLYSWENGRSLPSTDIFVALCDLYEVDDLAEAMNYAACQEAEDYFQYKRKELQIIAAYREHPELQDGIKKILGITIDEDNKEKDSNDNT